MYPALYFLPGVLLVALGVSVYFHIKKSLAGRRRVTGVFLEDRIPASLSALGKTAPVFRVRVRYRVGDRNYTVTSSAAYGERAIPTGETPVMIRPENPKDAILLRDLFTGPWIIMALGAVLLIFAALFLFAPSR